jgi:hypothetical protein
MSVVISKKTVLLTPNSKSIGTLPREFPGAERERE